MILMKNIEITLGELASVISRIQHDDYTRPCSALSNSTIGQHTRHIIELFQCLQNQYETGTINYDLRERNKVIENDATFACLCIDRIKSRLDIPNKILVLEGEQGSFNTNYFRELLYNLEHCIHHQALLKVALNEFNCVEVSDEFGVAPSTIKYRKQSA
jgi:hypothetical protein